MVRTSVRAYLRPDNTLGLVILLGTLTATALSAHEAGMGSGNTPARELVAAETTIGASTEQDKMSYAISVSSASMEEVFEACSGDVGCATCLEIDPTIDCKRDTIVNAFHCADVEEVLCCIFFNDSSCEKNKVLLQTIEEVYENVCPLELSCLEGGIGQLNLGGDSADLLIATGPDAFKSETEQGATVVADTEDPSVDAEEEDSTEEDADNESAASELVSGGATAMGVVAPAVATACAAAIFAGLAFVAGGM